MEPLLQIAHVSDLHVVVSTQPGRAVHSRWTIANWPFVGKRVARYIERGTLGHDARAWPEFERSLATMLADEPEWRDITYLCVTGDLSTWGDDASITHARRAAEATAGRLGVSLLLLYGNHDVWMGQSSLLPMQAPDHVLAHRHGRLRSGPLSGLQFPRPPVPPSARVRMTTLNSVIHDGWYNMLAMGWIGADQYWDPSVAVDQLAALAAIARPSPEVLVVLTHHPAVDPGPTMACENRLQNDADVAEALNRTGAACALVISGHTHQLFPEHDGLPPSVHAAAHAPLHPHQAQLTTGTLSQEGFAGALPTHSWQRLRFLAGDDPAEIWLERTVFERTAGSGEFDPLSADGNPYHCAELMRLV